jgi:hypothetical protein
MAVSGNMKQGLKNTRRLTDFRKTRVLTMNAASLVMLGTVKPDGTLELEGKTKLPPGRVRVSLTVTPEPAQSREDTWAVLERIWKENETLGLKPRTREEIDADLNALRDELEEHANQIEALQEEAERTREKPAC